MWAKNVTSHGNGLFYLHVISAFIFFVAWWATIHFP